MVSGKHFVWNLLWWTWCQEFTVERQGKIWVRDRWKVAKIYVNSWFLPLGLDMKQWNIWLQYLLGYLGWQTNWQQRSDSCWEPKIVIVWILWLYGGSFASHGFINWFLVFVACWSKNLNLEWATSESLGQYAGDTVVNRMWDHSGCVWKGVCQAARFFTCSIYRCFCIFSMIRIWLSYDTWSFWYVFCILMFF